MRIAFTLVLALAITGCGEMDVPPSHPGDTGDGGSALDSGASTDAGQQGNRDAGTADSGIPACQPEGYYCTGGRRCCDGLRCDFAKHGLTCIK